MPRYRRWFVPGGTYFFTVNLIRRDTHLLVEQIDLFRSAYRTALKKQPFETIAICILPNHLHTVWKLPEGDDDFAGRWRRIKSTFSRGLPKTLDLAAGRRPGERGTWQRRYWEHVITGEDDLSAHIDYVHYNPVKHGLMPDMDDWRYSSWHRWKREVAASWTPPPEKNALERGNDTCISLRSMHTTEKP